MRDEAERDVASSWWVAALSRQEKLPKLEDLLRSGQRRVQTPTEQREVLKLLSKRYGIPLREVAKSDG